jgi:hypothetical protein
MITDQNLRLCTDLDIGALGNNATQLTDVVDLGLARDIGEGRPLYLYFGVKEAFAGLTSLETQVLVDVTTDFDGVTGDSDPTILFSTSDVAVADIPTAFAVPIPPQLFSTGKRYLAVKFVCVGDPTAGKITVDMVLDIQDGKKFYASGFTVMDGTETA